jgi:zinc protease
VKVHSIFLAGCLSAISCMSAPSHTVSHHALGSDPGAGVFPYSVRRAVLDNGLKVILIPMPSDGLVSYWSIVRTGSRDEVEEGVTGFAHFFEHMMFRGSERFPSDVYDSIVSGMGAKANAYTTDDYTAYHLSFVSEDIPTVIEIEADRFQNLKYDEQQFKTEAGAVYGEYRKNRTNPFSVLFEDLQEAAFDRHTYKHTTIGFEADIQRMPEQFEYSKSFFQRFYRPENVVLLVVGDFQPEQTLELIRSHYGAWKKGYTAPSVEPEPPQTEQRRIDIPFEEGKTLPIVTVAFKGERFLPEDRAFVAASLIGELAFGETSPLYKKLVLDEQRLDSMFTMFGMNRDPKLWSVIARVKDPGDVAAVEGEILDCVAELRRKPVTSERLDAVRSSMKYEFLSSLTTPDEVANALARPIALTGDLTCIEQMYSTLSSLTPEDVQHAAQEYLVPERSTVALLHTAGEPIVEARAGAEPPVLLPVAADPNVSFKIWLRAGSQNDPEGKEGLAALTAAMLSDGGTARNTYEQVLERLFPLAGSYGASVDKEMTVFSGQVHRDNLQAFYGLFIEALLNPGFRPEDFQRLRERTISSIENDLRYSSDEELGKAALFERVFKGTSYEHLVDGTVGALKAITLDDVQGFYKEHYTRENLVIALGGSYPADLPGRLAADLARLQPGAPEPAAAPSPQEIRGRQVVLVEKPGPSTAISFGYPIDVHRGSREFYALWLANSWLGQHRNGFSRLYQVIREARGMNYGDYSYIEAFPSAGFRFTPPTGVGRRAQIFEVWIRPVPHDRALFALRAALREIELLVKNGLTEEQFAEARKFMSKYALHYAENTMDRLGYAVDDRFYGVEDGHLKRLRATMAELTREEVNAAIKKHIQIDNLVIAMVTEDAAAMRASLVADAPSPIDYGDVQKAAEVLAEDREIERYPLKIRQEDVSITPVAEMFAGKPATN